MINISKHWLLFYLKKDPEVFIALVGAFVFLLLSFLGLYSVIPALQNQVPLITATMIAGFILFAFKRWGALDFLREGADIQQMDGQFGDRLKKHMKETVYICSPILDLVRDADAGSSVDIKEYKKMRQLCMRIKTMYESKHIAAYYRGEALATTKDLEQYRNNTHAREESFYWISQSSRFVVIFPDKNCTSSMLVEIGYALAREIPCRIYYSGEKHDLPHLLRESMGGMGHRYEGYCYPRKYTEDTLLSYIEQDLAQDMMTDAISRGK